MKGRALRLVTDALPALISYVDRDGYYRFNNRAYEQWFGRARGDIAGRHAREVLGETAYERLRPHFEAAWRGERVTFEDEIPYREGGTRYIHAEYVPDVEPSGTVGGFFALITDMTERRRTGQALLESESRRTAEAAALSRLHELSSQLWRVGTLSEGLEAMLAATIELLGADFGNVQLLERPDGPLVIAVHRGLPPEFLEAFREVSTTDDSACGRALRARERMIIEDIEEDPPYEPFRPIARRAGYRAVQSTPLIGRDGNALGMISTHFKAPHRPTDHELRRVDLYARQAADFIDRKRAEDAIRRHSEQFETVVAQAPIGVVLVDADLRIRTVNPVALPAFGALSGSVVGRDLGEVLRAMWEERFASEVTDRFRHTLETGEPYASAETAEFRIDTRVTEYYDWRLDRIRLPDGGFGVVCYFREISAHVLARKSLEESREALAEADRRKDEFLATLAHELRNPLAPIRNSLHLLEIAGGDPGTLARVQQMMKRQVNQMVRLVDDLMEVSRITRGQIELRKQRVQLTAVIRSAVDTSRPLIESGRHTLDVSLPPEPVTLDADPIRIAQVLANLLNNAAKYTSEGGRIQLAVRRESGSAVISVRDNGMGISAGMIPRIFDLFTQGDRSLNRPQGGLGVGLTLVRTLVNLHGGTVEARSDGPGTGSEFIVRLPMAPGQRGATPTPEDAPLLPLPRRILVVDDNLDAAESLGLLLGYMGADVTTVHDGFHALDALGAYRPSVVLLDIGMPGMDGYETARRMRERPEGRDVTIVALTGWGKEGDRRRSKEAGIDHHLVKPVDPQALLDLLSPRR